MSSRDEQERLAILVHEVRSPVAALGAIAEAYATARDPGARASLTRLSVSAARALERLVLDAAVASVRAEQVDLLMLVRDVAATAELRGANVRVVSDGPAPAVVGDPVRLRQALDNLVTNALVHSSPADEVVLSVVAGDDAVRVSVADQGPGIPREQQERIFEAGIRLDESRPGSGLGLSLARAVAVAHGGELTVASTRGGGARFDLVLPRR